MLTVLIAISPILVMGAILVALIPLRALVKDGTLSWQSASCAFGALALPVSIVFVKLVIWPLPIWSTVSSLLPTSWQYPDTLGDVLFAPVNALWLIGLEYARLLSDWQCPVSETDLFGSVATTALVWAIPGAVLAVGIAGAVRFIARKLSSSLSAATFALTDAPALPPGRAEIVLRLSLLFTIIACGIALFVRYQINNNLQGEFGRQCADQILSLKSKIPILLTPDVYERVQKILVLNRPNVPGQASALVLSPASWVIADDSWHLNDERTHGRHVKYGDRHHGFAVSGKPDAQGIFWEDNGPSWSSIQLTMLIPTQEQQNAYLVMFFPHQLVEAAKKSVTYDVAICWTIFLAAGMITIRLYVYRDSPVCGISDPINGERKP